MTLMPELDRETRTCRLLLVDDEGDVRGLHHLILEDAGFKVTDAGSAHEAAREALKSPFDVAVIDQRMPRVRGMALARWLRKRFPQMRVLILSAYADWDMFFRASDLGVVDVISKSLPVGDLVRAAKLCASRRPRSS